MKYLKYQIMQEINMGTEDAPDIRSELREVTLGPMSDETYESNLAIAQAEAYNGEVTVEDVEAPETAPTQLDQIEAQVAYTAMMTDTLLEV